MQNILNRFSKLHVVIFTSLILSALFVIIALSGQPSPTTVSPLSGVVIEETLAENRPPAPTPNKPGPEEQNLGWTAWSG